MHTMVWRLKIEFITFYDLKDLMFEYWALGVSLF